MRKSILIAAAILLLPTKGHLSQVVPDYQELRNVSGAGYVVVARPLTDPPPAKIPSKYPPNYTVVEVLRGAPEIKVGDRIRVGPANESFNQAMGESQGKGLPMPSVVFPVYQRQRVTKPGDPEILFLIGTDVGAKNFNLRYEGATESVELLDSVKVFIGESNRASPR